MVFSYIGSQQSGVSGQGSVVRGQGPVVSNDVSRVRGQGASIHFVIARPTESAEAIPVQRDGIATPRHGGARNDTHPFCLCEDPGDEAISVGKWRRFPRLDQVGARNDTIPSCLCEEHTDEAISEGEPSNNIK